MVAPLGRYLIYRAFSTIASSLLSRESGGWSQRDANDFRQDDRTQWIASVVCRVSEFDVCLPLYEWVPSNVWFYNLYYRFLEGVQHSLII